MKTLLKKAALLALLVSAPLVAQAQTKKPFIDPFSSAPTTQENTVNTTETAPQAKHTAQGLLTDMLRLINSTQSKKDLSLSRVNEALGIELQMYNNDPNNWLFSEQITPDWQALVLFETQATWGNLDFIFLSVDRHPRPEMTEICQVDIDAFEKELVSAGFAVYDRTQKDGIWGDYRRGDVYVTLHHNAETLRYPSINHNCVSHVNLFVESARGDKK